MKTKLMRRALATLVAAARVRWLQAGGHVHHRLQNVHRRLGITPSSTAGDTVYLANIAEGTHEGGITKLSDAAITERWVLGKVGSASDRVAICGAADIPIGVITDEASAAGEAVCVSPLGASRGTVRMVASVAVVQGALLEPAASGRVQTLGAGAGTHHVVGRALDAASAAGDVIEVDPFYFLRVI
jgi:hypothetical protein